MVLFMFKLRKYGSLKYDNQNTFLKNDETSNLAISLFEKYLANILKITGIQDLVSILYSQSLRQIGSSC